MNIGIVCEFLTKKKQTYSLYIYLSADIHNTEAKLECPTRLHYHFYTLTITKGCPMLVLYLLL